MAQTEGSLYDAGGAEGTHRRAEPALGPAGASAALQPLPAKSPAPGITPVFINFTIHCSRNPP